MNSHAVFSPRALSEPLPVFAQPTRDVLTGLPDRLWFINRLEQAIERGNQAEQGFAVFFIDLDLFKRINDTMGHRAGDRALIEAARRLTIAVRSCDVVARYGGDEFTILVDSISRECEAAHLAQRIISHMKAPFFINDQKISLAASVGIALGWQSGSSAESMIDLADNAMYRAKARGGSCYESMKFEPAKDKSFFRWKLDGGRHEVIFNDLLSDTVSAERLRTLERR